MGSWPLSYILTSGARLATSGGTVAQPASAQTASTSNFANNVVECGLGTFIGCLGNAGAQAECAMIVRHPASADFLERIADTQKKARTRFCPRQEGSRRQGRAARTRRVERSLAEGH